MTVLVAGASGATGRLLVEQLLERGVSVRVIVRPQCALREHFAKRENVTTICAPILALTDAELAEHVNGCDAVASCLGHNLSLKGIYASPRRLVVEATRRLCRAIQASKQEKPVKFVLMNTAGNSNRDLNEPVSFGQRCAVRLIRMLLPPHVDNEEAADFLRVEIGQDHSAIEWVVVRPDTLINNEAVTPYEEHASPIRSAIFNPGSTSRINVAHFMACLITDEATWERWRGQMPVIYNTVHD